MKDDGGSDVSAGSVEGDGGSVGIRRSLGGNDRWRNMRCGVAVTDWVPSHISDQLLQKWLGAITHKATCMPHLWSDL